jgi:50S ribosomal subunit-associated GTPase HflX
MLDLLSHPPLIHSQINADRFFSFSFFFWEFTSTKPESDFQKTQVLDILKRIGVPNSTIDNQIEVWNKKDLVNSEQFHSKLTEAKKASPFDIVPISALTGEGHQELIRMVEMKLQKQKK